MKTPKRLLFEQSQTLLERLSALNPAKVLILAVAYVALFAALAVDLSGSKSGDINIGRPSPVTIKASRGISYIDYGRTEELKTLAADKAPRVFRRDKRAEEKAISALDRLYAPLISVPESGRLELVRRLAESFASASWSEEELAYLSSLSAEQWEGIRDTGKKMLSGLYSEDIRTSELALVKARARKLAVGGFSEAENKFLGESVAKVVKPNRVIDQARTAASVAKAVDSVSPVRISKQKGEVIVREGEIVNSTQARLLQLLGLTRSNGFGTLEQLAGLAAAVLVLWGVALLFLREFKPNVYVDNRLLALISILVVAFVAASKALVPYLPPAALPLAGAAMLATVLISRSAGLIVGLVASLLLSLVIDNPQYVLAALIGSLAGVYLTAHVTYRSDLTKAMIWLMVVMGGVGAMGAAMTGAAFSEIISNTGMGVLGGFVAGAIAVGASGFLEWAFNITTDMKLLELANPHQPLLRELMMAAPGTYNHCIVTGNLAESAAEKVGANPLLTRVGAYYHDIGKIRRPFFFIENQYGDNPHDKTKPNLSCLIITAHVKEGVELAEKYRLPREIVDIIYQHHGNSLVSYFYSRAKDSVDSKEQVQEADFRYPGERPRSREAALVMLADAAEAAARSIAKPTPAKIEQLIKKVIQEKLQDGQLDESRLTLGDLDIITKIYARTLTNMYHSRIDYPTCELPRRGKGVVTGDFGKQLVRSSRRATAT